MSEDIQVEQPTISNSDQAQSNPEGEGESVAFENGSTFGKFKDATSLLEAYTALESEFTRKSQKLAELTKAFEEKQGKSLADAAALEVKEGASKTDFSTENARSEENQNKSTIPSWSEQVDDFFLRNPEAKEHAKDIAQVLRDEADLRKIKNGIDIAFKIVQANAAGKPADLAKNPKFIEEHIMNNESLKSEIIREYLSHAKTQAKLPRSIGGESSFVVATSQKSKPNTLESAGKIFEQMLKGS